jgi:hypothetical protein
LWKRDLDTGTDSVVSYVNNGAIPYYAFQYGVGAYHAASNTLYIIGPVLQYAGGTQGDRRGVIAYNLTTGVWSRLADIAKTIIYEVGVFQGNKATVIGNNIYFIGANSSGARGVAVYTIGTGITKFTSMFASGHAASIGYQNSVIYVIGQTSLKAYAIADDSVTTKIASLPETTYSEAADILNGNLYYARWAGSCNGTSFPNPPPSNIRKVI